MNQILKSVISTSMTSTRFWNFTVKLLSTTILAEIRNTTIMSRRCRRSWWGPKSLPWWSRPNHSNNTMIVCRVGVVAGWTILWALGKMCKFGGTALLIRCSWRRQRRIISLRISWKREWNASDRRRKKVCKSDFNKIRTKSWRCKERPTPNSRSTCRNEKPKRS